MRTAFLDVLEESIFNMECKIGIPGIPSLVTSGQYSLLKGNGHPFLPIREKNEWVVVSSGRHNSARIMLELIWSKISFQFGVEMPWNDGLYIESIKPLLMAKSIESADGSTLLSCSTYECSEKFLIREDNNTWKPYFLGKAAIDAVILLMCRDGFLMLDEEINRYFVEKHNTTISDVVCELISSNLFMQEDNFLSPIVNEIYIITLDDSTGYVCSEKDRLDIWCEQNTVSASHMCLISV